MRSVKIVLLVIVASFFTQSCYKKGGPWGVKGKGENIKETRDVSGFNKINLSIDADVSYTQDSIYKVEISAQSNIMKILSTEVVDSELRLDYKRNVWNHNKVTVVIHSPNINRITISGSGDVHAQNSIVANNLDLFISGSGNFSIPGVTVSSLLFVRVSGSGSVQISDGTVDKEDFNVSGSGNIDALQVVSRTNISRISGSGDISANVTESLEVNISGSGGMTYRGKPEVTSHISGSGKLIHLN
jgi:hypothetical protein